MRNRYKGKCELCHREVQPKQGRWRESPKQTQNFTGLRCFPCSTTTKKGIKITKNRLNKLNKPLTINKMKKLLTELKAERDKLNKEIERLEQHKGTWRPKEGERYYYVDSFASVSESLWTYDSWDKARLAIGNVYRTRELAQAHVDYLKALTTIKHYIADNDLGVVPDWSDKDKCKYGILYNHEDYEFGSSGNWETQELSPFGYLKSRKACDRLIEACKNELLTVFRYE